MLLLIAKVLCKFIKKFVKKKDVFYEQSLIVNREYTEQEHFSRIEDKSMQKGLEGEEKIIRILLRIFPKANIIHDAYFRDDELVTTQVDVIAIDTTGIYVIESKAYSGIVKGKTNEKSWVQLFYGKKYQSFFNPVMQNERHIVAIKNNLKEFNLPEKAFKSYLVFDNNCKLEIEYCGNCSTNIVKQRELFYDILEKRDEKMSLLNEKQVQEIANRIRAHANVGDKLKIAHMDRRRNKIKYKTKGR